MMQREKNVPIDVISENWSVLKTFDFKKEEVLKSTLKIHLKNNGNDSKSLDSCWFIPTKINQGCYDALQLQFFTPSNPCLRLVQLTVGKTHDLKLRFLIKIINLLKELGIVVTSLQVDFVVPPAHVSTFKIGEIQSYKNEAITNLGWDPTQTRVVGFKRAGQ